MPPRISSTRLTVTIGWMAGLLAALVVLPALASRTTLDLTPGAHRLTAVADHGFGQFTTNTSQWITNTSYFDPQVEFLELAASVDGQTTWKLYGPDADGSYGGLNGRGGFDAIVPGPELFCPVLSDARGDVHAVYDQDHGQLHWNPARSGAYGGVPGYRPPPLGHGANIVQASAHGGIWRDPTGYYWRGARYYDGESFQWLSFDPYGFGAGPNPHGYWPDPVNYVDADGRLATSFANNPTVRDMGRGFGTGRSEGPAGLLGASMGQQLAPLNALHQAFGIHHDYGSNLRTYEGHRGHALNATFNPATKAMLAFGQAHDGIGYHDHNRGQRLMGRERKMLTAMGIVHSVETVGMATGIRAAPGAFPRMARARISGPPPLPPSPPPLPMGAARSAPEVVWNNGWRTPDGKFASRLGGGRAGADAEQAVWESIRQKPGWNVIEGRVSVRNAAGDLRVYDGVAVSPRGRVIGLEVKSGSATRTGSQSAFDAGVNTFNPAIGVGQNPGLQVGRSILITVP